MVATLKKDTVLLDQLFNVAFCNECAEKLLGEPQTHRLTIKELRRKWYGEKHAECERCKKKLW
jgi:DNA polymerase III epsilon subunit-like protein